jgi:hypothetical protein
MSDGVLMQYLGFESNNGAREYAFQVRYTAEDIRDYRVTVENEIFASRRISFQDAPDLCSAKLKRELTTNAGHLSGTTFVITEGEVDAYRSKHTPISKHAYTPKPRNES